MKPALPLTLLIAFGAGTGVGFLLAGKKTEAAPGAASGEAGAPSAVETISTGVAVTSSSQADPPPRPGTQPITADELKVRMLEMDSWGYGSTRTIRRWADLSDRLRVSDPAALAKEIIADSNSTTGREMTWNLVMSAYAEKDPNGAWAFTKNLKPGPRKQMALMSVVSVIAQSDPNRALTLADDLTDEQMKRQIRTTAIMNTAQRDPAAALELAMSNNTGGDTDFSYSMIFSQWARKDPERARIAISKLSGRPADLATSGLLSSLAQTDPEAAWKMAQSMPPGGDRYQDPRSQVIQNWAQSDPQAALAAAQQIPDPGSRAQSISLAVSAWSRANFKEALTYAVGVQDSTTRSDILRAMSMNPSGNRAELLNAVLEHMPSGDNFQQAVSGIVSSWARENPREAAAALSSLPPGRIYSQAVQQVASQWMQSGDKSTVLNWARQLPPGEGRENALSSIFGQWATTNPQEALLQLGGLTAAERERAISSLASGWGRKDPEAVIRWAGSLTDPKEKERVTRAAVSQLADRSPDSAARYIERLNDEEKAALLPTVVESWASKDVEAAAEWLSRQPQGGPKDSAINSLSRRIAIEDPETALSWAGSISNPQQRASQMESLARDWVRQDPTAAKAWINQSNLPADVRTRLLK